MRLPPLRHLVISLSLAMAVGCASAPVNVPAAASMAEAANEVGELAGAAYRIDIPAGWQGDLVVYARGYVPAGTPRDGATERDSQDQWALDQGFAIARSDYSKLGWSVAEALDDTERLRAFSLRATAPRSALS